MRCFLIYFFLFLFLLFLRRDPQSKGLFVKHAVSCGFFFFFFHREIQIHYLKRKKKNVGAHVFVVRWKVGCGPLTELPYSLEYLWCGYSPLLLLNS